MNASDTVAIFGQPGSRARASGLFQAALPLCVLLLLSGYAIGVLFPWSSASLAVKCSLVVFAAFAIFAATAYSRHRIDAFFKGASGEVAVAHVLARLPGGYSVFHGVDIAKGGGPFSTHDFDHVVLTPAGLVVVETKNWRGRLTFEGGAIRIDGITPKRPPVEQVAAETAALASWLADKTPESIPVRPLLCFAGAPLPPTAPTELAGVRLCDSGTLVEAIAADAAKASPLPPATLERISRALRAQV